MRVRQHISLPRSRYHRYQAQSQQPPNGEHAPRFQPDPGASTPSTESTASLFLSRSKRVPLQGNFPLHRVYGVATAWACYPCGTCQRFQNKPAAAVRRRSAVRPKSTERARVPAVLPRHHAGAILPGSSSRLPRGVRVQAVSCRGAAFTLSPSLPTSVPPSLPPSLPTPAKSVRPLLDLLDTAPGTVRLGPPARLSW